MVLHCAVVQVAGAIRRLQLAGVQAAVLPSVDALAVCSRGCLRHRQLQHIGNSTAYCNYCARRQQQPLKSMMVCTGRGWSASWQHSDHWWRPAWSPLMGRGFPAGEPTRVHTVQTVSVRNLVSLSDPYGNINHPSQLVHIICDADNVSLHLIL